MHRGRYVKLCIAARSGCTSKPPKAVGRRHYQPIRCLGLPSHHLVVARGVCAAEHLAIPLWRYHLCMLHEFLTANRDELINRCRLKVVLREGPLGHPKLEHGVPRFLDQLVKTLRVERTAEP